METAHDVVIDKRCAIENWQTHMLMTLGFEPFDAMSMIDEGYDYHVVEVFMQQNPGCSLNLVKEILRP